MTTAVLPTKPLALQNHGIFVNRYSVKHPATINRPHLPIRKQFSTRHLAAGNVISD
jgi:hypothetical protein